MNPIKQLITFLLLSLCSLSSLANQAIFHPHEIQFGLFDKRITNPDIPKPPSPIFWDSILKVDSGQTFTYLHTVFHTEKYFEANLGLSLSHWAKGNSHIGALSGFFELRIWLFRTSTFNPYFVWSVAGPTLLTRDEFAGANLSKPFIFQDYIGFGILLGKNQQVDISAKMIHYSNGDLFIHNAGMNVPIVFSVGYVF